MKNKLLLSIVALMVYAKLAHINYLAHRPSRNKYSKIYKSHKILNDSSQHNATSNSNKLTIFCMILTSKKNFESRVSITYDAWAHKCDDHDFVLLIPGENTDGERVEIKINNAFKLLQPEGLLNDSYAQLTDKVYHTIMDTYKYKKKYDWYFKSI